MPLFYCQDSDRPGYVVAENYAKAIEKWKRAVASENGDDDTFDPSGVSLVCDDIDLIVSDGWCA